MNSLNQLRRRNVPNPRSPVVPRIQHKQSLATKGLKLLNLSRTKVRRRTSSPSRRGGLHLATLALRALNQLAGSRSSDKTWTSLLHLKSDTVHNRPPAPARVHGEKLRRPHSMQAADQQRSRLARRRSKHRHLTSRDTFSSSAMR